MAAKRDYYEVLGVAKNADEKTIKKLTGSWRRSIIRIPMPEIRMQKRNSKK
ncbi:hypothetical protein COPCOM_03091 [Coprococcus comes ATCC 27758]|uniref:J domain-containing protein n=1 Tax=Coprococcus comes ATCC 27758 TaxID=470146 RepID=C0BD50_9FIRM|nr:hypothetical protein COPCOM_03091 [Coprococcus comes ATCC 27758]